MADNMAGMVAKAEREVSSFYQAVLMTYGQDEAMASVRDWLDIMESLESIPDQTIRYWRRVTILAAERLATRICRVQQA